jgi:hypothetical protein
MSSFYCSSIYLTVTQAFHRTPCLCMVPTHPGGHSSISSNILSVHALKLPIVHRLHPRTPPVRPHHCLVYHLHPRSRCLCTLPSLNVRDVVAKQSRSLEMASTSTFSPPPHQVVDDRLPPRGASCALGPRRRGHRRRTRH